MLVAAKLTVRLPANSLTGAMLNHYWFSGNTVRKGGDLSGKEIS
jgi:hypothetical protein